MSSILKDVATLAKDAKEVLFGSEESPEADYEKNITWIGTRGSSKTSSLGGLELVCEIQSSRNRKFSYLIDERSSGGISQISTDLCAGIFPKPTPAEKIYQADAYLTWDNGWRGKDQVHIRVAETSGEDIEKLTGPYRGTLYKQMPYKDADNLNRMIAASQAFIMTIAVPRSAMPLPQSLDSEPASLHPNPDLNAYRILNSILKYKKKHGAKPCQGVAVLLTKYDMVDAWLREANMSLYNPEGAKLYLSTYFRKTMGVLKNYGLDKVKFFPVHFQVEKKVLPDGKVRFVKWSEGAMRPNGDKITGYKIAVDYERNLPYFSEKSFNELLDWCRGFAA